MNEKDAIIFSKSRKPYIPVYSMISTLVIILSGISILGKPLNPFTIVGVVLFSAFGIGFTEIHRIRDSYGISDHYVVHKTGYIAKAEKKIHLKSITDIDARQGIWQRITNYGSILVQSASGSNSMVIRNINNPGKFISTLENKMKSIEDQV